MKNILSIALLAALSLPIASNAVTDVLSSSGHFGEAPIIFSDGCGSFSGTLRVAENSGKNRAIKTANSGASFSGFGFNICTNTSIFAFGTVEGINFKMIGNGKVITASGTIPVGNFQGLPEPVVENVSFNLTFTQTSDFSIRRYGSDHTDFNFFGEIIRGNSTFDNSSSNASITGGITTETGTYVGLPLESLQFNIGNIGIQKSHSMSLIR